MPFCSFLLPGFSTILSSSQEPFYLLGRKTGFYQSFSLVSSCIVPSKCSTVTREENHHGDSPIFFYDRNPFSHFLYPRSPFRILDACATGIWSWFGGQERRIKGKKNRNYIAGCLTQGMYQKSSRLNQFYIVSQCWEFIFRNKWNHFKFLVALTSAWPPILSP